MAWPLYLGMEDIQSLPDVFHELLWRIADLQEEEMSLTPFITHLSVDQDHFLSWVPSSLYFRQNGQH